MVQWLFVRNPVGIFADSERQRHWPVRFVRLSENPVYLPQRLNQRAATRCLCLCDVTVIREDRENENGRM